jgi:acyl-coenzyme A synthetase/AMP-(fatty) acid ligase
VETVAIIGIPDAKVKNLTTALIVKRQGYEQLSEHDILSVVAEKLPPTKQLYGGVYFIEEMPISENGKILRREAREIAIVKHRSRLNV